MRRFYKRATAEAAEGGWTVKLDGRPLRTPARAQFLVPTAALAEAVAAEWAGQGETIVPASMPLTGLANAAIDRIAADRDSYVDAIAAYAESDVVAYRAEGPADLVAAEAAAWDPLIRWASRRYDVAFEIATGVIHRPQPAATLARLRAAVAELDPFRLAALHAAVTVSGSLVVGLALAAGEIDADTAWSAGQVDELYQAARWGEDSFAVASRTARRAELDAAVRLFELLRAG